MPVEDKRNRSARAEAVQYLRNLKATHVLEGCPALDFSSAIRSLFSLSLGPAYGAIRFCSVPRAPTKDDGDAVLLHVFTALNEISSRPEVRKLVSSCSLSEADLCALICLTLDGRQTYHVTGWLSEWLCDVRCSVSVVRDKVGPLYTLMYRAMEKLPLVRCRAAAHIVPLGPTPEANDEIRRAFRTTWTRGGCFPMCAFETFVEIDPAICGKEELDKEAFGASPLMLLVCRDLCGVDLAPFTPSEVLGSDPCGGGGASAAKSRRRIAPFCPAMFYLLNWTSTALSVVWVTLTQDEAAQHRVAGVRPRLPPPPTPAVPPELRAVAAEISDHSHFHNLARSGYFLTDHGVSLSDAATTLSKFPDPEMQSIGFWALGQLERRGTVTSPDGVARSPKSCFETAVRHDRRNALAWTDLASCLAAGECVTVHGKSFSSLECLAEALRVNPRLSSVWAAIGDMLGHGEVFPLDGVNYNAKQCFIEALRHDPSDVFSWNCLARLVGIDEVVHVNGRDMTRAECFEEAVVNHSYDPDEDDELEDDGNGVGGDVATLDANSSTAAATEPQPVDFRERLLAKCHNCVRKLEANLEDAKVWTELGCILVRVEELRRRDGEALVMVAGRSRSARECFVEAVRLPGHPTSAWYQLGMSLRPAETVVVGGGAAVRNVECFTVVVEAEPENPDGWMALGKSLTPTECFVLSGKVVTRRDCLRQVVRLSPRVAELWYEMGKCFTLTGDRLELDGKSLSSLDCFIYAVQLDSCHAASWVSLARELPIGNVAVVNGKDFTAVECLCNALRAEPLNAHTWTELGNHLRMGDKVRVKGCDRGKIECLTQSLAIDKSIAKTWEYLSKLMTDDERFILNKKVLDHRACILEAVRLNPNARVSVNLISNTSSLELPHKGPKDSDWL